MSEEYQNNQAYEAPESGSTAPENNSAGLNGENQTPPSYPPFDSRQNFGAAPPPQKPKKKRNGTVTAIICIAVAYFVLLAAMIGAVSSGVLHFGDSNKDMENNQSPVTEEVKNPALSDSQKEDGTPDIKNEDYSGAVLSKKEIYRQNADSVVHIVASNTRSYSMGTGFVINDEHGYILTNCHVVEGAEEIVVNLTSGDSYKAELIGADSINDIAVLKIGAQDLRKVTIGDSSEIEVGEEITIIGNPLGELTNTLTCGVVSALDRAVTAGEYTINMFQTDAAANEGNSGGPAFDSTGAVVGVVSAKYAATGVEGISFCIPINDALRIANDLVEFGYVKGRPYFGVRVSTSTGTSVTYDQFGRRVITETAKGAYVESIDSGSCAEKAGLLAGDIITKLGDTKIENMNELINAKNAYHAGDQVDLEVYRNGEIRTLTIIFDEAKG